MDKPDSFSNEETIARLKTRMAHLERENQWYFSALELAASLDEFHRSLSHLEDPVTLLQEARSLICRIVPLDSLALYVVEPANSGFVLEWCTPRENRGLVENRVDQWIVASIIILGTVQSIFHLMYSWRMIG